MLIAILNLLIWLLILGLIYYVAIWILGLLGIVVPVQIVRIVGAIIALILLVWFLQSVLGGGPFPRLLP